MPIGSSSQICNCEPSPIKTSNKELIQNSLIELEYSVVELENSLDNLYGNVNGKPVPEMSEKLSFNETILDVPKRVNSLRARVNDCVNMVIQLDTGK